MCGLLEMDIRYIIETSAKYIEIEEIIVFGSRAMGNYKTGSDVDIAIKGKNVDNTTVVRYSYELNEESPLPYFFDIVNYNEISNEELKKHINKVGKSIYRRTIDNSNSQFTS